MVNNLQKVARDYIRQIEARPEKLSYKDFRTITAIIPHIRRELHSPDLDLSEYEKSRIFQNLRDTAERKFGIHIAPFPGVAELPKPSAVSPEVHNGLVSVGTALTRVLGA